ncbi:MAG: LysE family transporter [Pseudomonadota bacterium]
MSWAVFASVVVIHLAAAISPGPSFVLSVRTAAAEGFRVAAGLALGFGIGSMIWAVAALVGLALLFEIVPQLFVVLKIAGGAFLIYLGIQMWRHAAAPMPQIEATAAPRSLLGAVWLGTSTFLANPKPAVFFGSIFVSVVPPDTSTAWLVPLVLIVGFNEWMWYMIVGRAFSLPKARAAYVKLKRWIDRGFGTLIGGFGLNIALR